MIEWSEKKVSRLNEISLFRWIWKDADCCMTCVWLVVQNWHTKDNLTNGQFCQTWKMIIYWNNWNCIGAQLRILTKEYHWIWRLKRQFPFHFLSIRYSSLDASRCCFLNETGTQIDSERTIWTGLWIWNCKTGLETLTTRLNEWIFISNTYFAFISHTFCLC